MLLSRAARDLPYRTLRVRAHTGQRKKGHVLTGEEMKGSSLPPHLLVSKLELQEYTAALSLALCLIYTKVTESPAAHLTVF